MLWGVSVLASVYWDYRQAARPTWLLHGFWDSELVLTHEWQSLECLFYKLALSGKKTNCRSSPLPPSLQIQFPASSPVLWQAFCSDLSILSASIPRGLSRSWLAEQLAFLPLVRPCWPQPILTPKSQDLIPRTHLIWDSQWVHISGLQIFLLSNTEPPHSPKKQREIEIKKQNIYLYLTKIRYQHLELWSSLSQMPRCQHENN